MKILLLILLTACQTLGQATGNLSGSNAVYKKDMPIKVNGIAGKGIMTVPLANIYTLDLDVKDINVLIISTCHQQKIVEKPTLRTFSITSIKGLENSGFCPILVDTIDIAGANKSALIEIENEKLDAAVNCSGEFKTSKGTSVCQSEENLTQRITFYEDVDFEVLAEGCNKPIRVPELGYKYDFKMSKGLCSYVFLGIHSDNVHRLTTWGYTNILFNTIKPVNQ
jgi:hypothetical protein